MRIGLTYTGSPEKHRNYVSWLKGNDEGIEVVRLKAGDEEEGESLADLRDAIGRRGDPAAGLADCEALVLSGGVDIHPEFYGGELEYAHSPSAGWQKERDRFEIMAFTYALKHGMPILGVCRGLQLINISLQGTLIQDLGKEKDETHENVKGTDKEHPVSVQQGSLLYTITGVAEGEANSAHHQAIDKLGDGLAVNCRAADGTIEGIEWADPSRKPFMIAVQWHPERMFTHRLGDHRLYDTIRERFIEEIKKNNQDINVNNQNIR